MDPRKLGRAQRAHQLGAVTLAVCSFGLNSILSNLLEDTPNTGLTLPFGASQFPDTRNGFSFHFAQHEVWPKAPAFWERALHRFKHLSFSLREELAPARTFCCGHPDP
jgi:hypothetical protein